MVKDGQAVVYLQYLKGCAATKDQYLQAEAQARQKQLGFWNQKSPTMPWDYRRGKHSSNPQTNKVGSPVKTRSLPNYTNGNCNCSDFKTQAQAQQVLNAFPGDKFRLDNDADGIACERLP